MLKKLLIGIVIAVPSMYADWINDLSLFVDTGTLDQLKAENVVQTYVDNDEREIQRLELKSKANDEDGFWATVRGGTYQLQWAAAKASLRYHKKVLAFIKGLPKNEKDRTNLIESLKILKKLEEELAELKENYAKALGVSASLKVAGLIAAKEVLIKGRKAYIKSSFII